MYVEKSVCGVLLCEEEARLGRALCQPRRWALPCREKARSQENGMVRFVLKEVHSFSQVKGGKSLGTVGPTRKFVAITR